MIDKMVLRRAVVLVLATAMVTGAGIGYAFDMGNMINPSNWMGGNRDYGGPGYGYGVPGTGYPDYGYGVPGYGYGGQGRGFGATGHTYGVPQAPGYSSLRVHDATVRCAAIASRRFTD